MRRSALSHGSSLRCSFCHKSQEVVGKLVSSPSDYPRAYICDECIAICAMILEDDRNDAGVPFSLDPNEPHPLISHPLASALIDAVAQWITQESLTHEAAEELARVREIAEKMMTGSDKSS